jgi:membrane protease YdiL (CAAX protease family)
MERERLARKLPQKWLYVIGLVVILASEFILRDVFLPEHARDIHIGMAIMGEWLVLLLLIIFWVPKMEGNSFETIGFRRFQWKYLWIAILTYFILMIVWFGSSFVLKAVGLEGLSSLQPMIKEYSLPILFSLFLTGTFLEEIFYRGYIIERLTWLTGKSWLAGLISWLAFTSVHLKFFGLGPTLEVGILSAALVILYLKTRNIWPCILVHGINDVFAFLIAPLLIS